MSTAARKARRKAGIPFTKAQKTPTPLEERSFVTLPVYRRAGDLAPIGVAHENPMRSPLRIAEFLANGGRP